MILVKPSDHLYLNNFNHAERPSLFGYWGGGWGGCELSWKQWLFPVFQKSLGNLVSSSELNIIVAHLYKTLNCLSILVGTLYCGIIQAMYLIKHQQLGLWMLVLSKTIAIWEFSFIQKLVMNYPLLVAWEFPPISLWSWPQ